MSQNQLVASIRSNVGKSANQILRQSGNIPAVLYGPRGNILLEMAEESTRHLLEKMSGMHELVPINVTDSSSGESWTAQVILREVQKHPYKHVLTHLDFWELPASKEQIVRVPLEVVGESPGVKSGGVLQMVVWDIPVSCLPADIPAFIEVDASELEVGDSVRILDIQLPEKVSHSTEENYAVITIVGRVKEEEIVPEEEQVEREGEDTVEDSAEEETAEE
ncbi:MAG TPA: 50S ribosomal protein L25 [Candidatus Lambdaproteobacteria bacterium]|nr:50S ribosomal protein L25 [SAR324 cluster bacterium]HBL56461.1 50S ribosomal protein L25 [Deltaproteobacteria bacterium]HHZ79138.1 50S ribosomal protein L25 [Candidatus Lambdaproteobacteria bacterium]HIA57662.1 50S ribosomal protein L25 [Candidatus Lambdaproteobacteria bacterium]HIB46113.1 50S ribosomal protein L25 [Candidatus Lambdaproteobacteria bacterium]